MSKKLLLADDSITIQKVISITFANEDYDLIVVDNGDAALEKARTSHPDLVLADVFMPGKNGYELCAAIKQERGLKGVPVLLLTGTFEPFDENKASACGADGWIAKPFESQALIRKVEELLAASDDIAAEVPEVEDVSPLSSQPSEGSAPAEGVEADMWEELEPAAVAPAAPFEPSGEMDVEDGVAADEDLWSDVSFDDEELDQQAATGRTDEEMWGAATEVLGEEENADTLADHPVEEATLEDFGFEVEDNEDWQEEASPSPVTAPEDLMSAEASDDLWGDEPEGLGETDEQAATAVPVSEPSAAGVDLMSAEAEEDAWGTYEAPTSVSEPAEDEEEPEDILALSDEDILEEADLAGWDDEDLLSESPEDALDAGSEEPTADEEAPAAPFDRPSSTEELPAAFEEAAPVAEEGLFEEALFEEPTPEMPVASAPAPAAAPAVSEAEVARIVERVAAEVVERLAGTILEKIAWEVVPDLAESLIKEEIRQIKEGAA